MKIKCPICLEVKDEEFASAPCGHIYHLDCIETWIERKGGRQFPCPVCQRSHKAAKVHRIYPSTESSSPVRPSTRPLMDAEEDEDEDDITSAFDKATECLKDVVMLHEVEDCHRALKRLQSLPPILTLLDEGDSLKILTSALKALSHIIHDFVIPPLVKVDDLKDRILELSTLCEELSEKADAQADQLKEAQSQRILELEKQKAEFLKREKEKEDQIRRQRSEAQQMKSMYDELLKENKELKRNMGQIQSNADEAFRQSEDEVRRFRSICDNQKKHIDQMTAHNENRIKDLENKLLVIGRPPPSAPASSPRGSSPMSVSNASVREPSSPTVRPSDMPWKRLAQKRESTLGGPAKPPLKRPRTETQIGPLHLSQGKLKFPAQVGSRARGLG